MDVRSPRGETEFAQYFQLRWEVLRQPWGEPLGSERDELDSVVGAAVHALILDEGGAVLAVGRLHQNSAEEAQIRYMAVRETARGRGLGRQTVLYLEARARQRGAKRVVLNARDTVAKFYELLGYRAVGEGPIMFGTVRHVGMVKAL
jgi:predicted GNAT family N-acyltransferase